MEQRHFFGVGLFPVAFIVVMSVGGLLLGALVAGTIGLGIGYLLHLSPAEQIAGQWSLIIAGVLILITWGIEIDIFLPKMMDYYRKEKSERESEAAAKISIDQPAAGAARADEEIRRPKMGESKEEAKVQKELIKYEKKVGDLISHLEGAMLPQGPWAHYKSMRYSRRASENLGELSKLLEGLGSATDAATKAAEAKLNLMRTEVSSKHLSEIEDLKKGLEKARIRADIAEQEEKAAKHEEEIHRLKKPAPSGKSKTEQLEAEAERQEAMEKKWLEELKADPNFSEDDIPEEIERRKRKRGWLDEQ